MFISNFVVCPMFKLLTLFVLLMCPLKLLAGIDSFDFSSDENRERYQVLAEELRCPKCKNSNLAGSNSMIATDLKREIHTMVEAGDSNEKIVDFMLNRYGDFVLYRPRLNTSTLLLWGTPIAILALALLVVGTIVRRRSKAVAQTNGGLTAAEQAQLAEVLSQGDMASISPDTKN